MATDPYGEILSYKETSPPSDFSDKEFGPARIPYDSFILRWSKNIKSFPEAQKHSFPQTAMLMYTVSTFSKQLPGKENQTTQHRNENYNPLTAYLLVSDPGTALGHFPGQAFFPGEGDLFQVIKHFHQVYYMAWNVDREKPTSLPICKMNWEERK